MPADIFEDSFLIPIKIGAPRIIPHDQVQISVVIVVGKSCAVAVTDKSGHRTCRDFLECAVLSIRVEIIGGVGIIADEEVQITIVVEVSPDDAFRPEL